MNMDKLKMSLDEIIKMDKEKEKESKYSKPEGGSRTSGQPNTRVFVGNLSYHTSWQDLKDFMKPAGDVLYSDVFSDRFGKSKGCGVVEFATPEGALNAIQTLNETELKGRVIYLKESNESKGGNENKGNNESREYSQQDTKERLKGGERYQNQGKYRDQGKYKENEKYKEEERYDYKEKNQRRSRSRSKEIYQRKPAPYQNKPKYENNYENGGRRNENSKQGYNDGYKLQVNNLPYSVSWQNLKDAFKQFGEVIRADIKTDFSGKSQGYGFVIFKNLEEAEIAVENMDKTVFNGRELNVRLWT